MKCCPGVRFPFDEDFTILDTTRKNNVVKLSPEQEISKRKEIMRSAANRIDQSRDIKLLVSNLNFTGLIHLVHMKMKLRICDLKQAKLFPMFLQISNLEHFVARILVPISRTSLTIVGSLLHTTKSSRMFKHVFVKVV